MNLLNFGEISQIVIEGIVVKKIIYVKPGARICDFVDKLVEALNKRKAGKVQEIDIGIFGLPLHTLWHMKNIIVIDAFLGKYYLNTDKILFDWAAGKTPSINSMDSRALVIEFVDNSPIIIDPKTGIIFNSYF